MVAIADARGAIQLLNRHCEEITGYALAEVAGRELWAVLPEADTAGRMRQAFERAAAGEAVEDDEGVWRCKDGSPLPVRWGYSCFKDAAGQVRGVAVTGVDVQAARHMQEELAASMDRHQGILDTAVDGIITIDERGLVESFNRAAERIFGYRAAEVIGRNVAMLMPPPYRESHDGYLGNYRRTRRKKIIGIGREVEGLRKDGTRFPLDLAVGEVVTAGQRRFTGIVRDITDRKEAERELRRRIDELAHVTRVHSMGELAAGLAHEINQPLTAIISYARACVRMLDAGTADHELLHGSLEQIARQGERASEVIRRLRKYVEKGEIDTLPGDLGASIAEALALLDHELTVNQVRVYVDVPAPLPAVHIDRVQIEQVLVNLVRNAVEAMAATAPAGRELHVAVCREEADAAGSASLRVSVRDCGPGFGQNSPARLFDPFFTTKSEGLGQGLAICRRIVEAHQGTIWAESAAPSGAVFSFLLPLPAVGSPGAAD
jgi:two-component system sensor kinase FixL